MIKSGKVTVEKLIGWFIPFSVLLIVYGIYLNAESGLNFWRGDALRGFGVWSIVIFLFGIVVKKLFSDKAPAVLLIGVAIFLFWGAGFLSSLAAVGFLWSTALLGRLLLSLFGMFSDATRFYELLIIGLIANLCIFGVMIHFAVNYAFSYGLILLFPFLFLMYGDLRRDLVGKIINANKVAQSTLTNFNYWHFLVFIWFVGYIGTYAFLPVVMSDDNNYHLGMWTQLTYHHQYLFDVKTLIWAVSPFAVDLLHSIISLISNSNARASLNLMFYLLLMMGLWSLTKRFPLSYSKRLLVLAMFASTPMLANLLQSLQTDLFLALLSVGGGLVLLDRERSSLYRLLCIVLLGCLFCATKLPALVLAGSFFIALMVSIYRAEHSPPKVYYSIPGVALLLGAGVFVALHSYVAAYFVAKNPFFPLYNGIFKSPFFREENFKDGLYSKGASFESYWGLFFDSQSYFESPADFVAGFQYLFLLPCALLLFAIKKEGRWLAILSLPMFIYAGIMFYMMQYLRYLFAVIPLASVLIAHLYVIQNRSRNLTFVLFGCIFINLYFLPGVSYNFYLNNLNYLSSDKKQKANEAMNPEIAMNEYVNLRYGIKNVLYDVSRSNGATLAGTPFYLSWCAPLHIKAADAWTSEEDVLGFLKLNNIELIYWYKPLAAADNYFRADIKNIIDKYGVLEKEINGLQLYQIKVGQ